MCQPCNLDLDVLFGTHTHVHAYTHISVTMYLLFDLQAQFDEYSQPMAYCPDKLLVRSTKAGANIEVRPGCSSR